MCGVRVQLSAYRDSAKLRSASAFAGGGRVFAHRSNSPAVEMRARGVQPISSHSPQAAAAPFARLERTQWADGGASAQIRADVARFFVDLRRTIGVSPAEAAAHLRTSLSTISALEQADAQNLPPWPQVQRIVSAYTAWARIDGTPVLTALGILARDAEQRQQMARQAEALRPAMNASSERLRQMRAVIAESAKRLPIEALNQARERPVRTFYALSVPLGLVLVILNTDVLGGALSYLPGPFKATARYLHDVMAVHFAPEREGLKWIEVTDPRSRRSDRLHQHDR